jgi:gp16 family phage-associated protein
MDGSIQGDQRKTELRTSEDVRRELALRGISVSDWAREMGYSPGLVHQVLAGRLRCKRGQAHKVAVALGLKEGLLGDISDLPFSQGGDDKP